MTDSEIIKALECCGDEGEITLCSICPYYLQDRDNDFCQEDLHRASLDLINRQKAEIERLKNSIKEADEFFSEGSMGKGLAVIINLAKEMAGD